MRFAGRMVAGTVAILLVTISVLVIVSEVSLRHDLEDDFAAALEREALLIREALPADSLLWNLAVHELTRQNGHRITVIDRSGRVRADSDVPAEQLPSLENHAGRPEVRAALTGKTGRSERSSATVGHQLLYVAVPGGPGVVRVAADLDQVNLPVHRAQRAVLAAAILAILLGSALAFVAGRSIAQPLTQIAGAARAISAGNVPRFPRSGIPDIDALVRALREMNLTLQERFEALRREQAEIGALVESMVEGVIGADQRGRIITANQAARQLLGYDADAPMPDLLHLFRSKAAREVVSAVLAGNAVNGAEIELDGSNLVVNARPLPNDGVVLVLLDMTEMRRLELVRRDFVANVSHELKTPLTSISGYAETLTTEHPDPDTSAQFLQVILSNARRMQRLVDSLLDLSRIESGRWQPRVEPVDIGAVAREVAAAVGDPAARQRVRFAVEVAPGAESVQADPDAVRQILTNLFDNALRYAPDGSMVKCVARPADGGIVISVSDMGKGIALEHLPRIFERFYRADPSRARDEGGTGLGLAIVKHLVEAHDGRVWAESERGKGTTVFAWFPMVENSGVGEPRIQGGPPVMT
ncbi:MAG TPA: ATP-binding protein [Gemmatimonadales bacterium]|nr:ATP-binding protein [Gemmatimonadales bacterium]